MDKIALKHKRVKRRKLGLKQKLYTKDIERKRLCVSRSNRSMYVQIIDDIEGKTLLGLSTLSKEFSNEKNKINKDIAALLGKKVAELAKSKGIDKVYFDRNGYLYHGKIKAFADAARENGLNF
jgi:large subunit ribosomal protein L18